MNLIHCFKALKKCCFELFLYSFYFFIMGYVKSTNTVSVYEDPTSISTNMILCLKLCKLKKWYLKYLKTYQSDKLSSKIHNDNYFPQINAKFFYLLQSPIWKND